MEATTPPPLGARLLAPSGGDPARKRFRTFLKSRHGTPFHWNWMLVKAEMSLYLGLVFISEGAPSRRLSNSSRSALVIFNVDDPIPPFLQYINMIDC